LSWSRTAHLHRAIERDLEAIRLTDPRLAMLYSDGAGCLRRFFRERREAVGK
jgi:hypothetical protein